MKERIAYQYSTAEQPQNFIRMWSNFYEDPNWKDKLTDSNGSTVDYDANGNPTECWGYSYYVFCDTLYYCSDRSPSKTMYALNLIDKRDYVYGVYTVHKDDAYELASRFGTNPRLDLADGLRYPHFNVDNETFEKIHFWFHQ